MENELNDILEALEYCDLEDLSEDKFRYDVDYEFNYHLKDGYSYILETGASKGVFIFRDLGFVIKIPFEGWTDTYVDDDIDEVCEDFCPFGGAKNNGWNYCEDEVDIYKDACDNKLEDAFVETIYLTNVKGHPIYVQKYIEYTDCVNHNPSPASKETKEQVKESYKDNSIDINIEWLASAFEYYGKEKFEKLLYFIKDRKIDADLHASNLAWDGYKPVILDYAGFYS